MIPRERHPAGDDKRSSSVHATAQQRPWGFYLILADESDHKVKRIVVRASQRLSEQRHNHRSEHWHIVSGEGLVTLDGREIPLAAGQSIDIPMGAWHRIANAGHQDLVLVEIQRGRSFAEDDIERSADDYGRA